MNTIFAEAAKTIEANLPGRFKRCYPRRIIPPPGYGNPRLYSASLAALTIAPLQQGDKGFLGGMNLCAQLLVEHKVPTYFIHPDFFKAVAATDVPDDFDFSELKWPAEAMVFCLPIKESKEVFGTEVPWIGVARTPVGLYQGPLADYRINFDVARFAIHFPVFSDGLPEDFGGLWPLDGKLGGLINSVPFEDRTWRSKYGGIHSTLTDEQNRSINNRAMKMAVSLMLAMVAEPEYIEPGEIVRKAKASPRPEKALDELWSPNMIGRHYRKKHEWQGGAHSSPRAHLRRGHYRRQWYGNKVEGRKDKVIWIHPTWVNL